MKPGVKSRFPCVAIENENGKRSTGVCNHNFHYNESYFRVRIGIYCFS